MKILIVGGGGFVGSWLTCELVSRGHRVVIVDPFTYYSIWDLKHQRILQKFKKQELLGGAKIYRKRFELCGERVFKRERPEAVVHLAGIPLERGNDFDISLKQLTDDIGLAYRVIAAVKKNEVGRFVYMSSISAYGDCSAVIDEDYHLIPKTPYGVMKASGEFLTTAELISWNIVRTTNIYGFGDMNARASNMIIRNALSGKKVWINKEIMMDFIYVKDIAAGIADVILKAPQRETFHISGGNAVPLNEFVKVLGNHIQFDYEVAEVRDRPLRGTMDNRKAGKIIGWFPKNDISSGVRDYMKYIKQYNVP